MEDQLPRVKATIRLGSESFSVRSKSGILSEQLISLKERSMEILKDYITRHNAPIDVPDEPLEEISDEEEEDEKKCLDKPTKKSKKQK
ncbi:hypothetical protein LUZ60_007112 [Juncus effusus]|nr:hypothetical protein LUZ60_007112 [Juncus effusus]